MKKILILIIVIVMIIVTAWSVKNIAKNQIDNVNITLYNYYDELATKGKHRDYYLCLAESFRFEKRPDCMKEFNPKK